MLSNENQTCRGWEDPTIGGGGCHKGGASMTVGDFLTMAAVIVAACLVYNFVKAYTKKK